MAPTIQAGPTRLFPPGPCPFHNHEHTSHLYGLSCSGIACGLHVCPPFSWWINSALCRHMCVLPNSWWLSGLTPRETAIGNAARDTHAHACLWMDIFIPYFPSLGSAHQVSESSDDLFDKASATAIWRVRTVDFYTIQCVCAKRHECA